MGEQLAHCEHKFRGRVESDVRIVLYGHIQRPAGFQPYKPGSFPYPKYMNSLLSLMNSSSFFLSSGDQQALCI